MKDFFISYNAKDLSWAEWIAWHLEEDGYSTMIQAWDFRPGSNFVLEMQTASAQADRVIAVLSPDYLRARYTQSEWAAAFAKDPTGERRRLVPVRVRECDLTGLINQIIYIDFVGVDRTLARERLLAGVRTGRAKPEESPGFPGSHHGEVRPRFPEEAPSFETDELRGRLGSYRLKHSQPFAHGRVSLVFEGTMTMAPVFVSSSSPSHEAILAWCLNWLARLFLRNLCGIRISSKSSILSIAR